jgi:hypothetical protein
MANQISLLSLSDRQQWERTEERHAMPSQCWRFAAALARSGCNPKLAVVDAEGSRLLLPFIEREWGTATDIATLPGLSGASIVPRSSAPLDAWYTFAAAQEWVTGYLQLSPGSYPNVPDDASAVHHGYVFLLDLQGWDLARTPSMIIRRKVSTARRAGALVCDDRPLLSARLQQLYPETLSRFGTRTQLSAATLDEWAQDPQNLLLGISQGGAVEGVHLIHVHGREAELHIVGLSEEGRASSALLYTAAIERLQARGVTRFNLGGGGNPGDGLYKFKGWLGGTPVPLQSIRHVYNLPRYQSLCAAAMVDTDTPWFPSYRTATPVRETGSANRTGF